LSLDIILINHLPQSTQPTKPPTSLRLRYPIPIVEFQSSNCLIMAPSLAKVVYQPDTQSTEEYIVIVHQEEVRLRWRPFCHDLVYLLILYTDASSRNGRTEVCDAPAILIFGLVYSCMSLQTRKFESRGCQMKLRMMLTLSNLVKHDRSFGSRRL
jgi:hypothetical protein